VTEWHFEDEECWVTDCMVCRTPMIVWRPHGLPEPELESRLLEHLERIATERYPKGSGSTPSAAGSPTTGTRTLDRRWLLRPGERSLRPLRMTG
jgi:hypothetical protein